MPSFRTTPPASAQGFSLVELMVVLAILAIVAMVAVPSYQSSIESNRRTAAANQLLGALQFARSEAVLQRKEIKVCATGGGSACSGNDWSQGGGVFKGADVLRYIPATQGIAVTGNAVTFKSDGTSSASSISVDSKTIKVNIIGHARIE